MTSQAVGEEGDEPEPVDVPIDEATSQDEDDHGDEEGEEHGDEPFDIDDSLGCVFT